MEILEKTVDGKDIISKYFAVNSLSELDQTSIVRIQNALLTILHIFYQSTDQIYLIGQEMETNFSQKFQSHIILRSLNCYYIEQIEKFSLPCKAVLLNNGSKVVRIKRKNCLF